MPFAQTNLTTSNFTQKADHPVSGTQASSKIIVFLGRNSTLPQHRLGTALGGGGEAAEPGSALGSGGREGQSRAGLHVSSTASGARDMLLPLFLALMRPRH